MAGYSAQILNLEDVEQGTTFEWEIHLQTVNKTPMDLSGIVIRSCLRKKYSDASPALTFTVTILDSSLGYVLLSATAAQMAALASGKYVYDVEVEDAAGKVYKPYKGYMLVTQEVTK